MRLNGRVYEALAAGLQRRPRYELYHSALEIDVPEGRYVIEMTPVPDGDGARRRGVVGEGAVGSRRAGRLRIFRYEIRRWCGGTIPDRDEAVSPTRLSDDLEQARRVLELVPHVPTPVWGRDELEAGEMWNSNSVISWLLARAGFDVDSVAPPSGGRAPGWHAGLVVARRSTVRRGLRAAIRPQAHQHSPAAQFRARADGTEATVVEAPPR